MTSRLETTIRYAHLGMLWGASLMVPKLRRSEWSEEWRNELWYVLRECSSQTSIHPRSIKEATGFCIGAYLRRNLAPEAILANATTLSTNPRFGLYVRFGPGWDSLRSLGNRPPFTLRGSG